MHALMNAVMAVLVVLTCRLAAADAPNSKDNLRGLSLGLTTEEARMNAKYSREHPLATTVPTCATNPVSKQAVTSHDAFPH